MNLKAWISAARPRTLPLALSCILMGTFLATAKDFFDPKIFGFAVLTTVLLQVLSNFANDYGDTQNGADNSQRIGPARAVQSGEISPQAMWKAIVLSAILAFASGLYLLFVSFGIARLTELFTFLGLGVLCILAAYFYTAGKKPYGYSGLGDFSVLLFFGLVGVLGVTYLFQKTLYWEHVLPALSCGLLATGVLNLNNIRDISSDKQSGKITIPVRIGKDNAKLYHLFLLSSAMLTTVVFAVLSPEHKYWFLLAFPLFIYNIYKTFTLLNPDPLLKQLALSTLFFVLLMGLSLLL